MVPRRAPPRGAAFWRPLAAPLAWDGDPAAAAACVYVTPFFCRLCSARCLEASSPKTRGSSQQTCAQHVRRSDRHHTSFGGGPLTAQGGSTIVERSAQKPAVSCEAVERFALGPNFYKALTGDGGGRRVKLELEPVRVVLRWVRGTVGGMVAGGSGRPHRTCSRG